MTGTKVPPDDASGLIRVPGGRGGQHPLPAQVFTLS
jgi:hypothetical protein